MRTKAQYDRCYAPLRLQNKMKIKKLSSIINLTTTILVILIILIAVALVGVRLVGISPYAVLSGSMEPTYHTGSLVYVKKIDCNDLKAGDPITFMLDKDTVATHRITKVLPDEEDPQTLRFVTKGDANESEDAGTVHCRNIIGTPVFTIPYLGYVSEFINHPPGTYIAIAAAAVILMLAFVPDLFDDENKNSSRRRGRHESDN